MRITHLLCGICATMTRTGIACHYCGAYRVQCNRKTRYFNRALIEMYRAIPMPKVSEFVLQRVIDHCAEIDDANISKNQKARRSRPNKPSIITKKIQIEQNLIDAALEVGFTSEEAYRLAGR